jgi:hypothetical protein
MNLYILIIVIIIFEIIHPNYETCDYNSTFYTTFCCKLQCKFVNVIIFKLITIKNEIIWF